MPTTLALTNATGRQSASLARAASAVGFHILAHIPDPSYSPLVASELSELPRTKVLIGSLSSGKILEALFKDADLAFINTTSFDDELAIGRDCAKAAEKARAKHLIYSSMPDHADAQQEGWFGLPHYRNKWEVEKYIRSLAIPSTFVYTGIYHNNFTSLPYPLFCLREVPWREVERWDGDWEDDWAQEKGGAEIVGRKCGFEWQAPFPKNVKLPWLDCEHDFGPAVLQLFKEGPEKWAGRRVPLAFSLLDPPSVCAAFSRGLNRPVRYIEGPIEVCVPIPPGYQQQLDALQELFGGEVVKGKAAPYWWGNLFDVGLGNEDGEGSSENEDESVKENGFEEGEEILAIPRKFWGGWRDVEGYASDAFLVEERLNGRTWMEREWRDKGGNLEVKGGGVKP